MPTLTLYHNPRCSKSRAALELLRERGVEPEIVAYLDAPPGRDELRRLLSLLPGEPGELVRRDARFRELGLDAEGCAREDAVVELLVEHPELLQRPVAVAGGRARIGRPPERVLELLEGAP